MSGLTGKHILVGVTGGIAAYKSADLVRRLRNAGAAVRVAMTQAASQFVTPLTFQALSGQPVSTHLLDPAAEAAMGHIELARWADAIVVAPATANFIAKLAHGFADDLLSTICLARDIPLAVAPAMNRQMWSNPATQANCQLLLQRGVHLWGPGTGEQACGEIGAGRLLEVEELLALMPSLFAPNSLAGLKVVITAGPTREPIDPVRYISNRSSGKMGFALAAAASSFGAQVILVSGPTALAAPNRVTCIDVETAQEMHDAVLKEIADCDIFIGAAAVADYAPAAFTAQKIKKHQADLQITCKRTPDILQAITALAQRPFTVGFAAETADLEEQARKKLHVKAMDMICANWVGEGRGFDVDENEVTVIWTGGQTILPKTSKIDLAYQIISQIAEAYRAQHTS